MPACLPKMPTSSLLPSHLSALVGISEPKPGDLRAPSHHPFWEGLLSSGLSDH